MKLLSIDCETSGLDKWHGARPFLVTICTIEGREQSVKFWEWSVDPVTRRTKAVEEDLEEIQRELDSADVIVGQNVQFDVIMLNLLYQDYSMSLEWDWSKTYDTLIAGHLLASNQPHNLTAMGIQYIGEDISKYEEVLKKIVLKARFMAKHSHPTWSIAKRGNPLTPSVKSSGWGFDMWLPRAIAEEYHYSESHPWWTVTSEYANVDSLTTAHIWKVQEPLIRSRGLWKIFLERMKLVPISMELEQRGVTLSKSRLNQLDREYKQESRDLESICTSIAEGYNYNLRMPKSGNNHSLREFCFGGYYWVCKKCNYSEKHNGKSEGVLECPNCIQGGQRVLFNNEGNIVEGSYKTEKMTIVLRDYLNLPAIKRSPKTGEPSLDKHVLESYLTILPPRSKSLAFVKALMDKRKRDVASTYMSGYRTMWLPVHSRNSDSEDLEDWKILHGGANPTGTDTLRWSFSNPNSANISKQEGFNLRYAFGPDPDREWWWMDGQNLELRIPTYEAGEEDLIYIFERPNEAPYYGSFHLVVFDLLHPKLFKKHGKKVKELFESTWYQWTKNFVFAVIYGCQEEKGDETARVPGAYKMLRNRFPKIAKLADKQIKYAEEYGYVNTIPDREIDPEHGYPIMCTRTDYGKILPTVPLNYHIQSTAMQWTNRCMVKCSEQLKKWQAKGFDAYITLQVHDELVFSFPRSITHPQKDYEKEKSGKPYFRTSNLWRARVLQRLMESCGEGIGVPTPVSMEYSRDSWDVGESF